MNKTIATNIAGLIFNIEEEAYHILHSYLESIRVKFSDAAEREEIMSDIEARIAELFQMEISDRKEVIMLTDVERIISIMGQPEDYQTDEIDNEDIESIYNEEEDPTLKKRLFRDKENATIGGVCSGLSAYFGLDPVLFRLLFIFMVLMGGSGIFLYLIMMFVVPEAKTTAEKLQMRGEKVNINNIKKHIKDLKDDLSSNDNKSRIKKSVRSTVDKGMNATSGVIKAFSQIVGFALVVGGIFGLFIIISLLIGETGLFPLWGDRSSENLSDLMDILYQTKFQSTVTYYSILAILFIPLIGMIATGAKLLFRIQQNFKTIGISMSILWFVAIGITAITSIQLGMEFREKSEVREKIPLEMNQLEAITILIEDDNIFSNHINYDSPFRYSQLIDITDDKFHMGTPELKIIENENDTIYEVEIIKSSKGLSQREAIHKAESIIYNVSTSNNTITLSPFLTVNKEDKLRNQEVTILVKIPEGKTVSFGKNINRMPPISCSDCFRSEKFTNSTWKMINNELKCVQCE